MFIGKKQAWIIVHETIKRDLPHASHDKSSLAESANTRIGVVAVTEPTLSIVEAVCTRRDGLTRNRSHQWNALSTILRFACSTFSLFLFLFFWVFWSVLCAKTRKSKPHIKGTQGCLHWRFWSCGVHVTQRKIARDRCWSLKCKRVVSASSIVTVAVDAFRGKFQQASLIT